MGKLTLLENENEPIHTRRRKLLIYKENINELFEVDTRQLTRRDGFRKDFFL